MTTQLAFQTTSIREYIHHLISTIIPYDDVEQEHINDTCLWIESGAPLLRVQNPNKHLVCDFVMFDELQSKVLMTDHKKSLLWRPTGGHIELDEHP